MPIIALAFVAGAVSCTGQDEPAPPGTATGPTPTGAAPVASDVGDIEFVPGEYAYDFNNISATLSMDGNTATLDVRNRSGSELGDPGMYVIVGEGTRYEGTVASASTIPDGDDATFQITFPEQVKPDSVGLAILLFGDSNAGAMAPVPE